MNNKKQTNKKQQIKKQNNKHKNNKPTKQSTTNKKTKPLHRAIVTNHNRDNNGTGVLDNS